MILSPRHKWTEAEYLEYEYASEERNEYFNGTVTQLLSHRENQNLITGNSMAALHVQLRHRPCFLATSRMRLKVSASGFYTYADLAVACDEKFEQYRDHHTMLNPALIIEVLTPETEVYKRGEKFQRYQLLDSLEDYVLIAYDKVHVERYLRQPDDSWNYEDVAGLDSTLELSSIGCTLKLIDVYHRIEFDKAAPDADS